MNINHPRILLILLHDKSCFDQILILTLYFNHIIVAYTFKFGDFLKCLQENIVFQLLELHLVEI